MLFGVILPGKVTAINVTTGTVDIGLDAAPLLSPPDTIRTPPDVRYDWWTMLKEGRLDLNDPAVRYPGFLQFCVNVYRWIDQNLNQVDREWVNNTLKVGKVRLLSDTWNDVYYFRFDDSPLVMRSQFYANLGLQANYSILSVAYSVDMNSLMKKRKSKHDKLSIYITLAKLYAEAYFWENDGGAFARTKDEEGKERESSIYFDGLNFKAAGVMGFYIFNNRRFSFSAPYDLSTYQIRSAGSAMAGVSGTFYTAHINFSDLPREILNQLNYPFLRYRLQYNSVNLIGGYSFNWVLNRHLLFNTTTLPGIGMSFSFSDSTSGRKSLFSTSIRQMLSLTYNRKDFFANANATFHGNLLPDGDLTFMSGILNFQVSAGLRF